MSQVASSSAPPGVRPQDNKEMALDKSVPLILLLVLATLAVVVIIASWRRHRPTD